MKDHSQSLPGQPTVSGHATLVHSVMGGSRRHEEALARTTGIWRRRARAAVPLLLAIATAVAFG